VERVRRLISAAILVLLVGAIVVHRDDLASAMGEIGRLDPTWIVGLCALMALGVAVDGLFTSAVTPQLSVGRAILLQQSVTGANNTVVGSGPVATGVRIAMMRSWGIGDTSIGVSLVALNVVAAARLWLIALATAVAGLLGADGGLLDRRIHVVVIVVAVVVLSGSAVLWWVLLCHPLAAARLAGVGQRAWSRLGRRWARLPVVDLVDIVERARAEARLIVRLRRWRIVATTVADQTVSVLKPIAVVRAFGIDAATISTWQVVIAYGLVRLVVALTPIPGGIGVTEIGLASLLIRFGGSESTVIAAVLTYRVLTFALPIVTGALCFGLWRWSQGGRPGSLPRAEPETARVVGVGARNDV
jgi:uncharacterized membrane protein YbhN (UPF0104 family)